MRIVSFCELNVEGLRSNYRYFIYGWEFSSYIIKDGIVIMYFKDEYNQQREVTYFPIELNTLVVMYPKENNNEVKA